MGSETLPSACYILSGESSIPFYSTSNGYNYRSPHSQVNEIRKQVGKLITDGIVETSVSEYNSLLLVVPKKQSPGSGQNMAISD